MWQIRLCAATEEYRFDVDVLYQEYPVLMEYLGRQYFPKGKQNKMKKRDKRKWVLGAVGEMQCHGAPGIKINESGKGVPDWCRGVARAFLQCNFDYDLMKFCDKSVPLHTKQIMGLLQRIMLSPGMILYLARELESWKESLIFRGNYTIDEIRQVFDAPTRWKLFDSANAHLLRCKWVGVVYQMFRDTKCIQNFWQHENAQKWTPSKEKSYRFCYDLIECGNCGKNEKNEPLMKRYHRCSRCLSVWYCSRECLKSHWRVHKFHCRAVRYDGYCNYVFVSRQVCDFAHFFILFYFFCVLLLLLCFVICVLFFCFFCFCASMRQ